MPVHDILRQRLQPLSAAVTSNRIALYSVLSTFAVIGTVANACRNYSNFYSVAIYLSRSGRSALVLANFGFLLALLCGRVLQRLFFGPLQPREVERLYDQTWIFVTESLLAFTIFRDDFDIPFVLMFGFLLFVKCFHWLMADRVETMDQTTYPGPPLIFHIRINLLFCVLWTIDIVMFAFAVESTLTNGVGGMVLFASEYAILLASALNSMARYVLSVIDIRRARTRGGENAPPMENKSMYIFYIELVTDFLKLATYLTFFMLILTFYGLPLNIIRDVYLTARSFITRLRALIRYHNATRDMDRRYPNATEAELSELSDRTCIICREEMVSRNIQPPDGEAAAEVQAPNERDGPNMTPKKLPCGHIFHFQCLRSWLERQQSCPTCRRTVLETTPQTQPQTQGIPGGGRPHPAQPGAAGQGPQAGQQPAGAVGPFAHGQFMPPGGFPQQHPPNVAWVPGQPAPQGFYYPVHMPPHPQQPPQLQQPPLFRGFYGPGGVWQPWGMDPQWFAQPPQQQGQAPAEQSSQQPMNPESTIQGSGAPTPTSTSSVSPTARTPTPRDAAAQAALRRMGSSQSGTSSTSNVSAATHEDVGATTTTSSVSAPAAVDVDSSVPSTQTNPRHEVPALIPLYDLGPSGHTARPPGFVSPANPYNAHPSPFFRNPQQNVRPQQTEPQPGSPRSSSSQTHPQHGPSRPLRVPGATAAQRPPLTRLPATLTDEQLARLDRLTRDAIDERLRVLEGVSGAVYRCIEELTRVRSVLPPPSAVGSSAFQGQGQERAPDFMSATNQTLAATGSSSSIHGDAIRNSAGAEVPFTAASSVNSARMSASSGDESSSEGSEGHDSVSSST